MRTFCLRVSNSFNLGVFHAGCLLVCQHNQAGSIANIFCANGVFKFFLDDIIGNDCVDDCVESSLAASKHETGEVDPHCAEQWGLHNKLWEATIVCWCHRTCCVNSGRVVDKALKTSVLRAMRVPHSCAIVTGAMTKRAIESRWVQF